MQGRIEKEYRLVTDRMLRFVATDIRKDRTGVHSRLLIAVEDEMLSFSNFNIERDEDRTRLANSAHKNLPEVERDGLAQDIMRRLLSAFCAGLWDAQTGAIEVGLMEGGRRQGGMPYLCKPFVIDGGGTIIYAPPGRGKSFSAMLLATSIDAGLNTLFEGIERERRGLYINIERDRFSMADRLARINDCLGLEEGRPLHFMNQRGKSLNDVINAAEQYVDKHGIDFVVLDSISRAGMGDLTENQPVNRTVDALNGLCKTWVALAHTPRSDESHLYGSVHFDAGMDIGVKLATESANDGFAVGVALTVTKANDGRVGGKPLRYVLEFDEEGLTGVRPPDAGEFMALLGIQQSPEVQMQNYLLKVGEAQAAAVAEELGLNRSNVATTLAAAKWANSRREGTKIFYSAKASVSGQQLGNNTGEREVLL